MKHPVVFFSHIAYAILGGLIYWNWRYNNNVLFIVSIVVFSTVLVIDVGLIVRKKIREEKLRLENRD